MPSSSTSRRASVASLRRQFDTRTLVLMPLAMALDIVLGTVVSSVLKLPIYLDSVGTILVAALAGPLAGALTGLLANLVWTYLAPPPFSSPYAAPFALVAVVVGLLAGTFARWGWLRPRPGASGARLVVAATVAIGLVALMAVLALRAWQVVGGDADLAAQADDVAGLALGWLAIGLVLITGSASPGSSCASATWRPPGSWSPVSSRALWRPSSRHPSPPASSAG